MIFSRNFFMVYSGYFIVIFITIFSTRFFYTEWNQTRVTRNQILNSRSQFVDSQNQLVVSQRQIVDSANQLAELQNQLVELQNQLVNSRKQMVDLKNHFSINPLAESRNQNVDATNQFVDLQKQFVESGNQIDDLKNQFVDSGSHVDDPIKQFVDLQKKIVESGNQIDDLKNQFVDSGSQVDDPINQLVDLRNQIGDSIDSIVQEVKVEDLIAISFFDVKNGEELEQQILREYAAGERDQYYIPKSYFSNMHNDHFDDTNFKDEYQREVYLFAKTVLKKMKLREGKQMTVIDVGCGSGYKLVHFLSNEFRTIGIEKEPAYSFLKQTYPEQIWFNGKKETATLPKKVTSTVGECDLGMSADVIEHFRHPDFLLDVLKSFQCRFYIISTPKRELLSQSGPPINSNHVREWTFHEFRIYLKSRGFQIIRSMDGVVHMSTQFHVLKLA